MGVEILRKVAQSVARSKPIRTALASAILLTSGSPDMIRAQDAPEPNMVNGLSCSYYNEIYDFSTVNPKTIIPDYQQNVSEINFDWGNKSPVEGVIDPDTFTMRCIGELRPLETGTHQASTIGDDGIKLWIGGELMIDDWNLHPATERSSRLMLLTAYLPTRKSYPIILEYFNNRGDAVNKLLWQTPFKPKHIIPSEVLFSPKVDQHILEPAEPIPSEPTPPTPPLEEPGVTEFPPGLRLAWVNNNGGNGDIFTGSTSGADNRPLSPHPQEDKDPLWATDYRIYWTSLRDGNWNIFAANPNDNKEPLRITNNSAQDQQPYVYGQDLVFTSDREEGDEFFRVYTAKTYGTEADVKLLNHLPYHQSEPKIYFDPYEKRLKAVYSVRLPQGLGGQEIFTQDLDGSTPPKNFSIRRGDDSQPTPSPNGRYIVFHTESDNLLLGLTDPVRETTGKNLTQGQNPSWHPNSQKIVFERDGEIYTIGTDGKGLINLTNHPAVDMNPVYSPDGNWIAFVSTREDGRAQIHIMRADGTGIRQVSYLPAGSLKPTWQPFAVPAA